MTVIPGIIAILGALFLVFYPLTREKLAEIESDLNKRREDKGIELEEAIA